ncbi:MAG: acyl-ACP desaturase [Bacteroidia bacterium]
MYVKNVRLEVMQTIEKMMDDYIGKFLAPIETQWQPSDLLPDPSHPNFLDSLRELRELAKEMSYDFWAVLIGDTITEEALPTYESWLMDVEGVDQGTNNGWSKWVRGWTAEENRHGDLLNKYLYLSGQVNMREVEVSTQHLINDGFDIGTMHDPYRNFVYTSFQEQATNLSHRRVGSLASKAGNAALARMCGTIAADEARHARAYQTFVKKIFEFDPSEMMLAFEDMMRKKIIMPAHFLRESGGPVGKLFEHFSNSAQRLGVYTTYDYINILESLTKTWEIDKITDLTDKAERARDYMMKLPDRLRRAAERIAPPTLEYKFKWIAG